MKNFKFNHAISANQLIPHGIKIEFDHSNLQMKLIVSDKQLKIYECDLLEEDYPFEYPDTSSILEIHFKKPVKSYDQPLNIFSTIQLDELIFSYFECQVLRSMGIELIEILYYEL